MSFLGILSRMQYDSPKGVDFRGFGFVQQFAKVEELLLGC